MKLQRSTIILALAMLALGCSEKDSDVRAAARESLPERPASDIFSQASTGNQAVATSGVMHYTCPNNCEGGGGDVQGNCPVCGTALEHNQAYHDQPINVNNQTPPPISNAANGAGQTTGVFHYVCPDGHEGGAASEGTCASCGKALVHNQAYHAQPAATPTPPAGNVMNNVTMPNPQTPEPAQNAAGVYHYTCSNGCAGGAGSAVACSSCGATLVHNQAYHN